MTIFRLYIFQFFLMYNALPFLIILEVNFLYLTTADTKIYQHQDIPRNATVSVTRRGMLSACQGLPIISFL